MWQILKTNWNVLLPLSALAVIPSLIFLATVSHVVLSSLTSMQNNEMPVYLEHVSTVLLVIALETIFYMFMSTLGRGAMIHGAAQVYARSGNVRAPLHWCSSLKHSVSCFCRLLCSGFIFAGAIMAGYFILMVVSAIIGLMWGIDMANNNIQPDPDRMPFLVMSRTWPVLIPWTMYLWFLISVMMIVFPVIVIENKPTVASIARALDLIDKRWCYVFCLYFIYSLVVVLISVVAHLLLALVASVLKVQTPESLVAFLVVVYLPQLVILPFFNM